MTVADRIKQKRMELEWSQSDLATKANYCDKTAVSKLENSGNDISMKQVKRIAEALGVTTAYLMGWEKEIIPDLKDPNAKQISRALSFCEKFDNAPPEIQSAIASLLKLNQSDF